MLNTSFSQLTRSSHDDTTRSGKKLAKYFGLPDVSKVGKVAKWVAGFKLAIMAVDLFFMAAKGNIYFWGRNALTKKLTDKQGFSGEMGTATTSQLEQNAQGYESRKERNQRLTSLFSVLGVVGLPLLMLCVLSSRAKIGKGLMGKLKKMLPAFDYHNKI